MEIDWDKQKRMDLRQISCELTALDKEEKPLKNHECFLSSPFVWDNADWSR